MSRLVLLRLLVLGAITQGLSAQAPQDQVGSGARAREFRMSVDAARLALAELVLAEEKLEHARILFEKQFITRGEVNKDQRHYDDRLVMLNLVSAELVEAIGSVEAEQVILVAPVLNRLLLHPLLPPAERSPAATRVYDRLADALAAAAQTPEEGLAAHLYRLRNGNLETRVRAASVLGQCVGAVAEVLPDLIGALDGEEPRVVQEAVTSIGLLGPEAESAIPTLERLTELDDPQIAERAKAALRQIRDG